MCDTGAVAFSGCLTGLAESSSVVLGELSPDIVAPASILVSAFISRR